MSSPVPSHTQQTVVLPPPISTAGLAATNQPASASQTNVTSTIQRHPDQQEPSSSPSNTGESGTGCWMRFCRVIVLIFTFGCVDINPANKCENEQVGSPQENPPQQVSETEQQQLQIPQQLPIVENPQPPLQLTEREVDQEKSRVTPPPNKSPEPTVNKPIVQKPAMSTEAPERKRASIELDTKSKIVAGKADEMLVNLIGTLEQRLSTNSTVLDECLETQRNYDSVTPILVKQLQEHSQYRISDAIHSKILFDAILHVLKQRQPPVCHAVHKELAKVGSVETYNQPLVNKCLKKMDADSLAIFKKLICFLNAGVKQPNIKLPISLANKMAYPLTMYNSAASTDSPLHKTHLKQIVTALSTIILHADKAFKTRTE